MDVTSPVLPATALLWQPRHGQHVLVVVVKASFRLADGVSPLAAEHEPIAVHDQHWDDDPSRFLVAASDVVPAKRRVDVVYVGRAVGAPGATTTLVARLRVAGLEKTIEVRGDRWPPLGPVALDRRGPPEAIAWARHWSTQPLREGSMLGIFNAAPPDQQIDELPADAAIELDNLEPGAPTLRTALPGATPRVEVDLRSGRQPLPLRADTIVIDGRRGVATVVWRGQIGVEHPSTVRGVTVELDPPARAPGSVAAFGPAGPPLGPLDRKPARTAMAAGQPPPSRPLPFAHGQAPAAPLARAARPSWESFEGAGQTAAIPVLDDAPAPPPAAPAPPPRPAPAPVLSPPPSPPAMAEPRPWGAPAYAPHAAPAPAAAPRAPIAPPQHVSSAALGGVTAASDAAADAAPRDGRAASAARRPASGHRLLWHDEASVLAIRSRPEWRPILTRRERRAADRDAFASADVEDASEVLAIVREGAPAREAAIRDAIESGFDDEGRFVPELVLVDGELVLALDELALLRAVVATTAPFAPKDEALRRVVEVAAEHVASPAAPSPGAIARDLTDDVRVAWAAWKDRPRELRQVDELAARAVLETRAYRTRDLFGAVHVRAAITPSDGATAVPVYLPEAAAKKLPLFLRFPARVVAEVHPREDEAEEHPVALRAVALARAIGEPRGGA